MNHYLKEWVKTFYDIATNFEYVVENLYAGLDEDKITLIEAMNFNDTICQIYDEGMYLVKQICRLYQNKWNENIKNTKKEDF